MGCKYACMYFNARQKGNKPDKVVVWAIYGNNGNIHVHTNSHSINNVKPRKISYFRNSVSFWKTRMRDSGNVTRCRNECAVVVIVTRIKYQKKEK